MSEGMPMAKTEDSMIYIIDDDHAIREALEDLLASVSLRARSFGSVQEFLNSELVDAPSCLVLDVRMPGQSGMEFLRRMDGLGLHLPTVVITGHGDIAMGVSAMKDGAIEFLTKPFRDQDLLDAIHLGVAKDGARRAKDAAVSELRERWATLTRGEQDVMPLVVQGLLNKQIAARLEVSEITVKVRRSHLMRKMGAQTLADLIRFYDRIQPT